MGILLGIACASTLLWFIMNVTERVAVLTSRVRMFGNVRGTRSGPLPVGYVPLDNIQEAEYVGKVSIGTPPRQVRRGDTCHSLGRRCEGVPSLVVRESSPRPDWCLCCGVVVQYTVVFDTGSANLWVLSKEGTHIPSGKGLYVHDRSRYTAHIHKAHTKREERDTLASV